MRGKLSLERRRADSRPLRKWARGQDGDRRLVVVPDFMYVSDHSHPHRPVRSVRRVCHGDLPPETHRGGGQSNPINDPFAIARQVWAIWRRASPIDIARRGVQAVCRRVNKVGQGGLNGSIFARKWPVVEQILNEIPHVEYVDPSDEDLSLVVAKMHGVRKGGIVRVGSFALTLRSIFRRSPLSAP